MWGIATKVVSVGAATVMLAVIVLGFMMLPFVMFTVGQLAVYFDSLSGMMRGASEIAMPSVFIMYVVRDDLFMADFMILSFTALNILSDRAMTRLASNVLSDGRTNDCAGNSADTRMVVVVTHISADMVANCGTNNACN